VNRFLPLAVGVLVLALWEVLVRVLEVPQFVLPPPTMIVGALVANLPQLVEALAETLKLTLLAFAASFVGGLALAILFVQSRLIERSLLPYAVTLQVTPIVSSAPLIIIWVLFPDPVERQPGAAFGRPGADRPVPALSRNAVAIPMASATAEFAAGAAGRSAHQRRAGADRQRGGGIRCRLRRGNGSRLADRAEWAAPRNSADVRRPAASVADRPGVERDDCLHRTQAAAPVASRPRRSSLSRTYIFGFSNFRMN
jgi:hypothetical protein